MVDRKEAKPIEDKLKALGFKNVQVTKDTYNYEYGERYIEFWIPDVGGPLGLDIKILYQDIDDLVTMVEYLKDKK